MLEFSSIHLSPTLRAYLRFVIGYILVVPVISFILSYALVLLNSFIGKMKRMKNLSKLRVLCWDCDIEDKEVFNMILNKSDKIHHISSMEMRLRIFRYLEIKTIKTIFSDSEFQIIIDNVDISRIRNKTAQKILLNRSLNKEA